MRVTGDTIMGTISVYTLLHLIVCLLSMKSVECMMFQVELKLPRYVLVGDSAVLECDYSISKDDLRKVEWIKSGFGKIFQYIKGRSPPYKNFSFHGAKLDRTFSNERRITLTNLDFDASGAYSCEVSTETPIYTKPSNDEELTVIQAQREPPIISVRKSRYLVGDVLEANCTTSPARPVPDITWFVNGRMMDDNQSKFYPVHHHDRLSSATMQLSLEVTEMLVGPLDHLELSCLSTIPAYLGPNTEDKEYVDRRFSSLTVEVEIPSNCVSSTGWPTLMTCVLLLVACFRWQ